MHSELVFDVQIAIRERDDYSPGPSCEPFRAKFATENKLFEATMLASAL